jgi:hypothetical protein
MTRPPARSERSLAAGAPPASGGLSARKALQVVGRGLLGGLVGALLDALKIDRTGTGTHRR